MKVAALRWAAAGWRVLPWAVRTVDGGRVAKVPLLAEWQKRATSDPTTVSRWWEEHPEANIGILCGSYTGDFLAVLDIDVKGGKNGFASLRQAGLPPFSDILLDNLEIRYPHYATRTPSGGWHFWHRSSRAVRSLANVGGLAGVDVRGVGGWIAVAPSRVGEMPYLPIYGFDCPSGSANIPALDRLPNWAELVRDVPALAAACAEEPRPAPTPSLLPPPLEASPEVLARARAYIQTADPAISGQGGSAPTFRVAVALVHGFRLSEADALALLSEYSARCVPPWTERELRHKLADAVKAGPPSGKAPGWLLDAPRTFDATPAAPPQEDAQERAQKRRTPPPPPRPSAVEVVGDGEDGENDATAQAEALRAGAETVADVPFPDDIVGATAEWILDRLAVPYPPTALWAALAFWAVLGGRRARWRNQGTNLYLLLLLAQSFGKAQPQRLVRAMLREVGCTGLHLAGGFSSWNAGLLQLHRARHFPVVVSLVDEASSYLKAAADSEHLLLALLKAGWSAAEDALAPTARMDEASGKRRLREVLRPSLSALWATQPERLGSTLTTSQITDGFLGRALCATARGPAPTVVTANLDREIKLSGDKLGQRILERAWNVWQWIPEDTGNGCTTLEQVEALDEGKRPVVWAEGEAFGATQEAKEGIDALLAEKTRVAGLVAAGAPVAFSLFDKTAENASRLALARAVARCGGTGGPYTILGEEVAWGARLVRAAAFDEIGWAADRMADSPHHERVLAIGAAIRAAPRREMQRRALVRRFQKWTAKEIDAALGTLEESGQIAPSDRWRRGPNGVPGGWRWIK